MVFKLHNRVFVRTSVTGASANANALTTQYPSRVIFYCTMDKTYVCAIIEKQLRVTYLKHGLDFSHLQFIHSITHWSQNS